MYSDGEERMYCERIWVYLQPFLYAHGYQMRARYHPDWVPSWHIQDKPSQVPEDYEDGVPCMERSVVNAIRVEDNQPVMLKLIDPQEDASERFWAYLFEPPRGDDLRNRCCPVLDVLHPDGYPGQAILVMPRLLLWNLWPFDQVREAIDFFSQIFEGLAFMHEHNFAHLDLGAFNILMDGLHLFKEPYHPAKPLRALHDPTRDVRHYRRYQSKEPIQYYFIDFEGSVLFESFEARHAVARKRHADKTVPEESSPTSQPCDPFALDIYCVGNLIREHWLEAYKGVEFIRPLVEDMVQTDPAHRPTAAEVVTRFQAILSNISPKKLSRRLCPQMEYFTHDKLIRRALSEMRRQEKLAQHERKLAARAARPPPRPLAKVIMQLVRHWSWNPRETRNMRVNLPATDVPGPDVVKEPVSSHCS